MADDDVSEVSKLLSCSLCSNLCAYGVITPCCSRQACRMCGIKKLIQKKRTCWRCKASIKPADLVKCLLLKVAVKLFQEGEPIPSDILNQLKVRHSVYKLG